MRSAMSTDSQKLTPWEKKVVSCHGDYREEAFLEDGRKPHYEYQKTLPRLPVPSIEETLDTFLPTALPLVETPEEAVSLKQCVRTFKEESQDLQARLLQRAQDFEDSSWLQHWWNTLGYLQVRDSVVINVSYYFHFQNDHTISNKDPQISRAASLVWNMVAYRNMICSGQKPAEAVGKKKTPLCSTAVKYMFHATRVPQRDQDCVNIYDPSLYRHVVVACRGQFFEVEAVDENHRPVSLATLEESLRQCREAADAGSNNNNIQLGWLTAANRDEWAEARTLLLQKGGTTMEAALERLESGAIMICLDEETPVSKQECAGLFLHGNTPGNQGICNRWFDKSIQLIVGRNGKAGLMGEHSMMDGMPVVAFADHITKKTYKDALEGSTTSSVGSSSPVTNIFEDVVKTFEASSEVRESVSKAKADFLDFTGAHEIDVQSFHGYGSSFIKKAGYSPDAFVQLAMQLATYRLWGKQGGTYEATQVRPFLHGRTETTRTVSPQSAAFVQSMGLVPKRDEHTEARKQKLDLLQQAVISHSKYLKLAAQAKGVDRHFLGLSLCATEGETLPKLYDHPVFARSKTWRVSTSNLSHPMFENWGYGEVVPNGVGLSYSVNPRSCVFGITALKKHSWTSKLSNLLEEALLEMRTLIEADQPPPQSKL